MSFNATYLLVRAGAAAKAGAYSKGAVHYQVLTDLDRQEAYLSITENEGGSGYFSKEFVSFQRVRNCIEGMPPDKPLASKAFKEAFAGRSVNNAGFLAAILRGEGLLAPAAEGAHLHVVTGDWDRWKSAQLAAPAEPLSVPAKADQIARQDSEGERAKAAPWDTSSQTATTMPSASGALETAVPGAGERTKARKGKGRPALENAVEAQGDADPA